MKENNMLIEGFWDSLITKTKQGALAVAGSLGSSKARGKLSASLLSDAMFQQWNEFAASTGSELNKEDFSDFLRRMGFSQEFSARETAELEAFLGGYQNPTDTPRTEPSAEEPAAEEPAEEPTPDPSENEAKKKAEDAEAAKKAQQDRANLEAKKKRDYEAQERLNQRRNRGSYESVYPTGSVINEDVVSDGELRKYFDQMAKRALKSGDAKSAAQKSVKVNRISKGQQASSQTAPEAPEATQDEPAAPEQETTKKAPEAQPAAPAPTPTPTTAPGMKLSGEEKQFFDALGSDANIGSQVKANDPLVQDLAQKVMQAAFERYKAANPGKK
jgi:hypothetical protein